MKVDFFARKFLAAILAGSVLTGCGSLGEGVAPVSATIQPLGGLEGATSTKAFACLNTGLTFILTFSDGSRGDFTARATYSSSNPAVAAISNADIAVPEQAGSVYSRGVIVPKAVGTATITARYLTFTRTIDVVVGTAQNFRVFPAGADLAAKSLFDLAVFADLDGLETPLDSQVLWSIVTPNTNVATIDSITGTITGVASGSGLTARARIPGCDGLTADASVTVANLQSLALTREFGSNDKLIVGTTERLIATGTLDNGKTQDLSNQVTYTTGDSTAVSFFTGSLSNLALSLKASTPVQLGASFASPAVAAPAISITPVAESLNTVTVTPATVDVLAGRMAQFKATGNYASGATQDITRHVGWSSSDTSLAVIQSSVTGLISSVAGQATTSSTGAGKSVTITATATNAASQSVTSMGVLNIK